MSQYIRGQLEIDHDRGVIYFHDANFGITKLRICNLPKPIPEHLQLDITHMVGTNWFTEKETDSPEK